MNQVKCFDTNRDIFFESGSLYFAVGAQSMAGDLACVSLSLCLIACCDVVPGTVVRFMEGYHCLYIIVRHY